MATNFLTKSFKWSSLASSFYRTNTLLMRRFSSRSSKSNHIAIDFGATNSRLAVMEGTTAKVIDKFPSVVAFNENGQLIFGSQAKSWAKNDPKNTVFGIMRLMGRKFDDPEMQKEMKRVSYKTVRAPNGDVWVESYGRVYSPTQIGSYFITKMKKTAERYLLRSVCNAVITVPSEWGDEQYRALMQAGLDAGLDVQVYASATTAAAISHGFVNKEGLVAVLDFGGRAFDVSVIEASNGKLVSQASRMDTSLGGEDFDYALMEYLVSESTEEVVPKNDKSEFWKLREAAEMAKIELSSSVETDVNMPFNNRDASGVGDLSITLTRPKLENVVKGLIERMKEPCEECLKMLGITAKEVDEVLLIGGMARVPRVQTFVSEIFGKNPCVGDNPDDAVVLGAASVIQEGHFHKNIFQDFLR